MDTRTPSPYQETQVSMQAPNEGDNGSVALATSTENSIASADAITIKSPVRSSIDRSVEAGTSDSIDASFSSSNNKERERTSGESHVSERDTKGKRVQQMLKNRVHKQQARINTISKKIGHGVSRSSSSIHRSNSVPGLLFSLFVECTTCLPNVSQIFTRCWLTLAHIKLHLSTQGGDFRSVREFIVRRKCEQSRSLSLFHHQYRQLALQCKKIRRRTVAHENVGY